MMGELRWRCGRIEVRCDGRVEVEMWENLGGNVGELRWKCLRIEM